MHILLNNFREYKFCRTQKTSLNLSTQLFKLLFLYLLGDRGGVGTVSNSSRRNRPESAPIRTNFSPAKADQEFFFSKFTSCPIRVRISSASDWFQTPFFESDRNSGRPRFSNRKILTPKVFKISGLLRKSVAIIASKTRWQ